MSPAVDPFAAIGSHYTMDRKASAAVLSICTLALIGQGCGNTTGSSQFPGLDRAERYVGAPAEQPAGLGTNATALSIDGRRVSWQDIAPRLAEAAGAVVVEEFALDHAIELEAARLGISITQQDLDREREWLTLAVGRSALAPANDPRRLVTEVRRRRGLGPQRFAAMLRRNAILRAMVRDSVEITDEQLQLAWRIRHGERVRVRILLAESSQQAQTLRTQILSTPGGEAAFAQFAQAYSTDDSASLGGLIEPFSTSDPAYEESVRLAAEQLEPGQVSQVVSTQNGAAIILLTERIPTDGTTLAQVAPTLRTELARRQERVLMDQRANQLLASTTVRVIDPSLSWSVEAGRER